MDVVRRAVVDHLESLAELERVLGALDLSTHHAPTAVQCVRPRMPTPSESQRRRTVTSPVTKHMSTFASPDTLCTSRVFMACLVAGSVCDQTKPPNATQRGQQPWAWHAKGAKRAMTYAEVLHDGLSADVGVLLERERGGGTLKGDNPRARRVNNSSKPEPGLVTRAPHVRRQPPAWSCPSRTAGSTW